MRRWIFILACASSLAASTIVVDPSQLVWSAHADPVPTEPGTGPYDFGISRFADLARSGLYTTTDPVWLVRFPDFLLIGILPPNVPESLYGAFMISLLGAANNRDPVNVQALPGPTTLQTSQLAITNVPEPGSLLLMGLGLLAIRWASSPRNSRPPPH